MKKISAFIIFLIGNVTFSQLTIGKETPTNSSVSLEFGTENRGLILPWVTSEADVSGAVDGTFIYDVTDKKVKYRQAGKWTDLSRDTTGIVNTTLQDNLTEQSAAKIAIGTTANNDTTTGVLVLTDKNKAMVLPQVESPHTSIISPSAGMMVYDTTAKQLVVFNGTMWSFWKP